MHMLASFQQLGLNPSICAWEKRAFILWDISLHWHSIYYHSKGVRHRVKKHCLPYNICIWAEFSCIRQVEVYFRKLQYLSLAQSRYLNYTGIQWEKCAREFARLVSVGDTFLNLMSQRFIFLGAYNMDENRPCDLANHKLSPCPPMSYTFLSITGSMLWQVINMIQSLFPSLFLTIFILYSGKRSINQKACPFSNKMDFMTLAVSFD